MHKSVILLLVLELVILICSPLLSGCAGNAILHPIPQVATPAGVDIVFDIQSPKENTTYPNGTIEVIFNVTINGPELINGQPISKQLGFSYYQGDWMQNRLWCPVYVLKYQFHACNFSIHDVPYGQHTINFTVAGNGNFVSANHSTVGFSLEKTVSVDCFVYSNPVVEFLSPQNVNCTSSSFPLNFTVDHPVTEIAYAIDDKEPISISGNETLNNLPNGVHNVTIYATDQHGYTGVSETLSFNVNAPISFSTISAAALLIAIVIVGSGLLIFAKKRNVEKQKHNLGTFSD